MKRLIQCIGSVFLLALIIATVNPSASAAYTFSSQGYNDVLYWAGQKKPSDMTTNEFAAVILAVTWPEATGTSQYPPSPMTMGRADVSTKLYSFSNNSYKRAFFHAGVGAWQLDGGGLGSNLLTAAMISTYSASQTAATKMASLWSQASGTKQQKRTAAWQPWYACTKDADGDGIKNCEDVFLSIYNPSTDTLSVTLDSSVSRLGGAVWKTCNYVGYTSTFSCLEVDPTKAQGYKGSWYYSPLDGYSMGTAPTPVTRTMYTYGGSYEYRNWLKRDPSDPAGTVYNINISAYRPLGSNPRTSLTWTSFMGLCVNGDCSKSQ